MYKHEEGHTENFARHVAILGISKQIEELKKEFEREEHFLADLYLHFDNAHWLSMFDDDFAFLKKMSPFDFFNHVFKQYSSELEQQFHRTLNALQAHQHSLVAKPRADDDEVPF